MRTSKEIGLDLRSMRKAIPLSLTDVQEVTDGEYKASCLGAYERAERAISVVRYEKLMDFYIQCAKNLTVVESPAMQEFLKGNSTIVMKEVTITKEEDHFSEKLSVLGF